MALLLMPKCNADKFISALYQTSNYKLEIFLAWYEHLFPSCNIAALNFPSTISP